MSPEKNEVRRLLNILHTFMRMLRISNREVERRLDLQHGTISRLLGGQIEAKVELVLAVARAIGLEYEELFAFAYPDWSSSRPESDSARKLRSMLEEPRPSRKRSWSGDAGATLDHAKLFTDVKRAVREVLEEMAAEKEGGLQGRQP